MNKTHFWQIVLVLQLLFCSTISFPLLAQYADFSSDPNTFYKELQEHMVKTKQAKAQAAVEKFVENAKAGLIVGEQLSEVIQVSSIMRAKRMRISPHFVNYLNAINSLIVSGSFGKHFDHWHAIIYGMANQIERGNFNDIAKFLEFSSGFFEGGYLSKGKAKTWILQTIEFEFLYNEGQPRVSIEEASLSCQTAKDTMSIYNTSGMYFPLEQKWEGESGKVTWERVGFDPNIVYGELADYVIKLKSSGYTAENVTFYHKHYFTRPLQGTISDQISVQHLYPQFSSYELDIRMNNLAPQIESFGGFGLQGDKVVAFGNIDNNVKALMEFYTQDGRLIMKARSDIFAVKEKKSINSKETSVAIYFANDSIYHPSLDMRYNMEDKALSLIRDNKASSKIAFASSYHQLEAGIEGLFWNLNNPVVDFKMVTILKDFDKSDSKKAKSSGFEPFSSQQKPVVFESFNYYDENVLLGYRQVTDIDPVAKLYDYYTNEEYQVNAETFAKYLNSSYTIQSILSSIFQLVEDGFIYYDAETDIITIREKVENYMLAKKGEVDYDRIRLVSKSKETNAQLDLDTKDMLITGVERVAVSDSQKVTMYPLNNIVRVNKNRDMQVDGTIVAGNVDFNGKDFSFTYDDFAIKMDTVKSMQIYAQDATGKRKTYGEEGIAPINSMISDVTGTLFIDKNDNKSSLARHPSYPRFQSEGNSYLYYDNPKLFNAAYKREQFFFKLDEFDFPDLDEITPEQLKFPGLMVTGGIFNDFRQTAELSDDFSLGFTQCFEEKQPIYNKGIFTGCVSMNNSGLTGNGQVDYLSSMMTSEKYFFLPDSMLAFVDSFNMLQEVVSRDVEYPSAHSSGVSVKWLPKNDRMQLKMKENPFYMFEDRMTLKGSLFLSDKGVRGKGTMNFEQASIRSGDFAYKAAQIKADSSDVVIKNDDFAKVAFNSYNVRSNVDLDQMIGNFEANGKENIPIFLPYNQYKTEASEFFWLMDERIINIRMPDDSKDAYFTSTNKQQGGLKFQASGGVLDLNDNTIKADGVPFIAVADARIAPDNSQVFINPNAVIQTLTKARLQCDTLNKWHELRDVTVDIKGINEFEGSGEYRYRGKDMKRQKILFDYLTTEERKRSDEFNRDSVENFVKGYYTYASTQLNEEMGFKLSNSIDFKGKVALDSRRQFLTFDGFSKLQLISDIDAQWFTLKEEIDPNNIQIDVSDPKGERKENLVFGIWQDMQDLELYPAFLSNTRTPRDKQIFEVGGAIDFDNDLLEYKVLSNDLLEGKARQGNIMTLKDAENLVVAEGKFKPGDTYGLTEVALAGTLTYDLTTSKPAFTDMTFGFDFLFDEKLTENLGEALRYYNDGDIEYDEAAFLVGAISLVNAEQVGNLRRTVEQNGYLPERVPGLNQRLLFTNLDMKFDSIHFSLVNEGKFGLAFAGNKYVNRMVEGFIEIGVRQTGDYINLYFETDNFETEGGKWYYFNYSRGTMSVVSNDNQFNQMVSDIKEKKRKISKGGKQYQYVLAPPLKAQNFVMRMRGELYEGQFDLTPKDVLVDSLGMPIDSLGLGADPAGITPGGDKDVIKKQQGGSLDSIFGEPAPKEDGGDKDVIKKQQGGSLDSIFGGPPPSKKEKKKKSKKDKKNKAAEEEQPETEDSGDNEDGDN
ncbi:MAG: hypothetical protein ACPGXL_04135 [Chitinophagales bacterium]